MKKIMLIIFMGLSLFQFDGNAQLPTDMIRFSQQDIIGTARTLGVSGSNGALGGDFGAIHSNPASLGIYRKSEFMFSPGIHFYSSQSNVIEDPNSFQLRESNSNITLDNIGFVIATNIQNDPQKTFNIAIGYNRLARFNAAYEYSGLSQGSIGNRFTELAEGFSPNDLDRFYEGLAYETFVIGLEETGLTYFSDFQETDPVFKNGQFLGEGGINEFNIALASNINNTLSVGIKLGVPFFSYEEEVLYTEFDDENISPFFNRLEFDQYLNTTGIGFHTNVGVVYSPSFPFRLGFTMQTPTWFSMNDDFDSRMLYDYVDDPDLFPAAPPQEVLSPDGRFSYNAQTPWVIRGQAGYLLGKNGFVSAQLEYLNYSNAEFRYENEFAAAERNVNRTIRDELQSVINFSMGGEVAINKFRGRIGTSLRQNPTSGLSSYNPGLSLGVGFRDDNFFLDAAYRWRRDDFTTQPYMRDTEGAPVTTVDVNGTRQQLLLTFGFKLN
jgi:hypothetical protein